MTMLDAGEIRRPLGDAARAHMEHLEIFSEIGSTNSYLLDEPAPAAGRFRIAMAEHQTAGRGRMNRKWHSPASSGICMSMSYTFALTPPNLPCLTLAIGIGLAQALEGIGVPGVGLKWPNDIVVSDGKLGGILTEISATPGDQTTVVTGVGINFDLGQVREVRDFLPGIGSVSDLASSMSEVPSRSSVSAGLIDKLYETFAKFDANGFEQYIGTWKQFDWLRGQPVSVEVPGGTIDGICEGIDPDGALVLQTSTGPQRVMSGSVNLAAQRSCL